MRAAQVEAAAAGERAAEAAAAAHALEHENRSLVEGVAARMAAAEAKLEQAHEELQAQLARHVFLP